MEILKLIMANQVVAFIIVVGVVVFAHELGHFLAARSLGILVDEFSIGFGPRAVGFRRGRTEFRVGWIPLGGYVRMFGAEPGAEIPIELRSRAINTAALWKRFLVSAAGPGANVIVTFLFLATLSSFGIEKIPPQVAVLPGSVAASAGLRDGDTILSINGESLTTWEELTERVSARPGELLEMEVRGGQSLRKVQVRPALVDDESVLGEKVQLGRIGVSPYFQTPQVTVREGSLLGKGGLRHGDLILAIDGVPVRHFHEVVDRLSAWAENVRGGARRLLEIQVKRGEKNEKLDLNPDSLGDAGVVRAGLGGWGAISTDVTVSGFVEGEKGEQTKAAREGWSRCGLVPGDTFAWMDGFGDVHSRVLLLRWVDSVEKALPSGAQEVAIRGLLWTASGLEKRLDCSLPVRKGRDHLNRTRFFVDLPMRYVSMGTTAAPLVIRSENVPDALRAGATQTAKLAGNIFETIGKLVTGRIPMANLGGPVEIARVAGNAASVGLLPFLYMIAFISLNVGLLNLLPIPVLDGGTLLLILLEGVYGKPLPEKVQGAVQRAGVIFIVGLVLLVIYNDILRRLPS